MYDSNGKADKVVTTLIQDVKKGTVQKDACDGDEKTVENFPDFFDEKSKNYDWEQYWKVSISGTNNITYNLILEHGMIPIKDLKNRINAAYWTSIKDGSIIDQAIPEIQKNLWDDILYYHINESISPQVKKKIRGMADECTRSNGFHSGLIYLKCILSENISGIKYSVSNIKENLRRMKMVDFKHNAPEAVI